MSGNPTLTVYCGPMFSAKTSRLLLDLERFKREVLGVPGLDDEDLDGYIQYRLGLDAAEVFIAVEEYYGTQLALRQVYRVN